MVNWKLKYLKYKLKYINAKQKAGMEPLAPMRSYWELTEDDLTEDNLIEPLRKGMLIKLIPGATNELSILEILKINKETMTVKFKVRKSLNLSIPVDTIDEIPIESLEHYRNLYIEWMKAFRALRTNKQFIKNRFKINLELDGITESDKAREVIVTRVQSGAERAHIMVVFFFVDKPSQNYTRDIDSFIKLQKTDVGEKSIMQLIEEEQARKNIITLDDNAYELNLLGYDYQRSMYELSINNNNLEVTINNLLLFEDSEARLKAEAAAKAEAEAALEAEATEIAEKYNNISVDIAKLMVKPFDRMSLHELKGVCIILGLNSVPNGKPVLRSAINKLLIDNGTPYVNTLPKMGINLEDIISNDDMIRELDTIMTLGRILDNQYDDEIGSNFDEIVVASPPTDMRDGFLMNQDFSNILPNFEESLNYIIYCHSAHSDQYFIVPENVYIYFNEKGGNEALFNIWMGHQLLPEDSSRTDFRQIIEDKIASKKFTIYKPGSILRDLQVDFLQIWSELDTEEKYGFQSVNDKGQIYGYGGIIDFQQEGVEKRFNTKISYDERKKIGDKLDLSLLKTQNDLPYSKWSKEKQENYNFITQYNNNNIFNIKSENIEPNRTTFKNIVNKITEYVSTLSVDDKQKNINIFFNGCRGCSIIDLDEECIKNMDNRNIAQLKRVHSFSSSNTQLNLIDDIKSLDIDTEDIYNIFMDLKNNHFNQEDKDSYSFEDRIRIRKLDTIIKTYYNLQNNNNIIYFDTDDLCGFYKILDLIKKYS